MEIQIKRREVYGTALIYVCQEEQRRILSELTGKKTLDRRDVENLQKLGHTIYDCDMEIQKLIGK